MEGGSTGQESIYRGLKTLAEHCPEDTVVLIHDGVRPMINARVISDNIRCVRENGNAVTVAPVTETVISRQENGEIGQILDRSLCSLARAPQSFFLRDILAAHEGALREGRNDFIDSATMMRWCGKTLFTVDGPPENIKITTPLDYYVLRAMIQAQENEQGL